MTVVSDTAGSYRRLLGDPVLRGLAVADVCARLPQGMVSITLLLVAAQHASMTTAGLVVAGYTLGQGVTGPLRGRLADRHGLARVCAIFGGLYVLGLLCLLAAAATSSSVMVTIPCGSRAQTSATASPRSAGSPSSRRYGPGAPGVPAPSEITLTVSAAR